jgi:hypothetical protein
VKDGPKRRRETNTNIRVRAASVSAPLPTTAEDTTTSPVDTQSHEAPPLKKVHSEPLIVEIKSENDVTPISTPQLTHTQLSTPQIPHNQTPNSQQQLTSIRNRRFSLHFDQFNVPNEPFRSRLESFSEHNEQSFHDNKRSPIQETKELNFLQQKKDSGFEDGKETHFFHKEMDFENNKEMSFGESINKEISSHISANQEMTSFDNSLPKEMSFHENVNKEIDFVGTGLSSFQRNLTVESQQGDSNDSLTFQHGHTDNSPTFHHGASSSSPTFHHGYDEQQFSHSNEKQHSFHTSSESTFPGNHNPTFNDQSYNRLSEHFAPHEVPQFAEPHQNEQFMMHDDDPFPVLSVETDGNQTMNPFDSFTNMI